MSQKPASLKSSEPLIVEVGPKKLIGKSINTNFINDQTPQLWRSFMPRRNEIQNRSNDELISLQEYPEDFSFNPFDPSVFIEKWALAEVEDLSHIPEDMQVFNFQGGLYAVFRHVGDTATAETTFQYIFTDWLPSSGYETDQRPFFEILGAAYKRNDPASEEDIYIPVRQLK